MPRGRPKKKIAQQAIAAQAQEIAAAEAALKSDANPAFSVCNGKGWHWGFIGSRSDEHIAGSDR
jgi:hypothetical protein